MSQEDFNLSNLDDLDLGDFDMDLNLEDMEKVSKVAENYQTEKN